MMLDHNVVVEEEIYCQPSSISVLDVQYYGVSRPATSPSEQHFREVSTCMPKERQSQSPMFREFQAIDDSVSLEISGSETDTILMEPTSTSYLPTICSGSHTETGNRPSNEDELIRIDNLSSQMGYLFGCKLPNSFYAVFDGHGGSNASNYLKQNSINLFFKDTDLPQTSQIEDEDFQKKLHESHRKAFLAADQALSNNHISPSSCGTTALTALILGKLLIIANAGDSRAVLSRKGLAIQLSQDHRPNNSTERKRVEDLGAIIEHGYLNGELAVTRSLGDWYLKTTSTSGLISEPEIQQVMLSEDDEFLIIGCDGIWDVMSNQDAVSLVRCMLKRTGGDPKMPARELVKEALRIGHGCDNVTAIVVCFSSPLISELPMYRLCISEESRNKLRSLLDNNCK